MGRAGRGRRTSGRTSKHNLQIRRFARARCRRAGALDRAHLSLQSQGNKGFQVIEKDFPNSFAAKSEAAQLAALAGDPNAARKYFDQTEGKVDSSIWKSVGEYVRLASWTYSH